MLFGENGGGDENGDLVSGVDSLEGGPHCNFGFAESDVAAEQPVHGAALLEIVFDRLDGLELVRSPVMFESELELPQEIAGTYVTSDALYAQRYFDLNASRITIGIGDGRRERHAIVAVYRDFDGGKTLYEVVYSTIDGRGQLRFYHDGHGPNGRITLRHRPGIVWTKGEKE